MKDITELIGYVKPMTSPETLPEDLYSGICSTWDLKCERWSATIFYIAGYIAGKRAERRKKRGR